MSYSDSIYRARQIIRYRETATLRRPQINEFTASYEGGGGGYKTNKKIIWAGPSEKGAYCNFEIVVRNISIFKYCISFYWFCASTLENSCYNILNRMLDIPKHGVICCVIYDIQLHYVRKAISRSPFRSYYFDKS